MTLPTHFIRRGMHTLLVSLTAASLLAACGGDDDTPVAPITSAPTTAVTLKGSVQGVDRLGMRSYFGIPFAKSPVGDLRWRAPQAPDAWATAIAKTQSEAPCLQTSASPFRLNNDREDCLYLDVHAPTTGTGPFPVMVWIHGGAFNTGGTGTYGDPSPLVSKGVIVVNIAYRLGAMGFLGHPALLDNGSAGNYGVMDQQAALQWVQDNIGGFAGNKSNVTIFGESAGGMSVMTHLASPLSKNLFAKAIVQSGAYGVNGQLTLAQLQASSTTVVNAALAAAATANIPVTGCTTVDAACLRGLPADVVKTQLATAFNASMSSPTPSVDMKVLPKSIKATFVAGENNKVPVINGSNEDEYSLFLAIAEAGRRAVANNFDPTNSTFALQAAAYPATAGGLITPTGLTPATVISQNYPLANYGADVAAQPSLAVTALATDLSFACNGLNVSSRIAQQASPIFMYEFRDQTAIPSVGLTPAGANFLSFPQGAGHSYEIQYLFNLRDLGNAERNALQATMSQYWTNFAKNGDPNTGAAVPLWTSFSTGAGSLAGLDVASGGGVAARTKASFVTQHQCTLWSMLTF